MACKLVNYGLKEAQEAGELSTDPEAGCGGCPRTPAWYKCSFASLVRAAVQRRKGEGLVFSSFAQDAGSLHSRLDSVSDGCGDQ